MSRARGKRSEMHVPLPGSLETEIEAWCSRAMLLTMAKPNPTSPEWREREGSTRS